MQRDRQCLSMAVFCRKSDGRRRAVGAPWPCSCAGRETPGRRVNGREQVNKVNGCWGCYRAWGDLAEEVRGVVRLQGASRSRGGRNRDGRVVPRPSASD